MMNTTSKQNRTSFRAAPCAVLSPSMLSKWSSLQSGRAHAGLSVTEAAVSAYAFLATVVKEFGELDACAGLLHLSLLLMGDGGEGGGETARERSEGDGGRGGGGSATRAPPPGAKTTPTLISTFTHATNINTHTQMRNQIKFQMKQHFKIKLFYR